MRITFLGTNGWYNSPTGDTVCMLVEGEGQRILLDAGTGFARLEASAEWQGWTTLCLSHFHLDHIYGLHLLGKHSFTGGLRILTPEGGRDILDGLMRQPFTCRFAQLPYPVEVLEMPADRGALPFDLETGEMLHASRTLGYRLRLEGKTVVYCPDTGYCASAVHLAREADLLITECAFRPGESSPEWPHLNPETAARLAADAGAKRLVLVHFDASRYPTLAARDEAAEVARRIFPDVTASRDGMRLEW
ncbi:MAG: ribonuclease Z [Magnetococcales bacterium]|nr:ribonuclease Z [Magnetococcales bacterium]